MENEKDKLNETLDNANKMNELPDEDLNKVSGGFFETEYEDVPNSDYLNKYVRIYATGECGQVIKAVKEKLLLSEIVKYTIRLNNGGEVVLDSSRFKLLPPGAIEVGYSEDGDAVSVTF